MPAPSYRQALRAVCECLEAPWRSYHGFMFPRLLGDVGGTHARFGWQDRPGQAPSRLMTLRDDEHPGLAEVIGAYLSAQRLPRPKAACIGIANPVTGDEVRMTNRDWRFSISELGRHLGVERLKVINDFSALAWALPTLAPHERVQVGGLATAPAGAWPLALMGPGTGLGVGGLLPQAGRWVALAGEGGHVSLAARTDLEWRLLSRLRQRHGHVSAERVLSGQGLSDLYWALSLETQEARTPLSAAQITAAALAHKDPACLACLEIFSGFLGSVAGDLALTLGARGGVYLGGGIVPRLLGWFEGSSFRANFEAKGRFSAYLRDIPVWVIQAGEAPALRGAALALDMDET